MLMRASANAGRTSATAGLANATRRPLQSSPVERRVLQLQRTAGNRAVVTLVQRKAGCGCGGACGDCGPGRTEEDAPVQRAIGADLRIKGKYTRSGKHPSQIFFDFNSSALDAEERAKVAAWVSDHGAPTTVVAKASEEGGAAANDPVARARGQAVAAAIGGQTKPKVVVDADAGKDQADYRYARRVELAPGGHAPDDRCAPDPLAEERTQKALAEANALAGRAAGGARAPDPAVRAELDYVFKSSTDETASAVAINFAFLTVVLHRFAQEGQHVIGTPCSESLCNSANALYDRDRRQMVVCPDLWTQKSKTPAEVLLHESVHAGLDGEDDAYLHEPLFPFLSTKSALQNPDSYVEFTRAMFGGGHSKLRAPTGGFDTTFSTDEQDAVAKAIAWAVKNFGNAEAKLNSSYGDLVAGMAKPDEPEHLAEIEHVRKVLGKHFGATVPPKPPRAEDKWILRGATDRVRQLHYESGLQPEVTRGSALAWDRKKKQLKVHDGFFGMSLQEQARGVEWALINSDAEIPAKRRAGYLELTDVAGGNDYSATEG